MFENLHDNKMVGRTVVYYLQWDRSNARVSLNLDKPLNYK